MIILSCSDQLTSVINFLFQLSLEIFIFAIPEPLAEKTVKWASENQIFSELKWTYFWYISAIYTLKLTYQTFQKNPKIWHFVETEKKIFKLKKKKFFLCFWNVLFKFHGIYINYDTNPDFQEIKKLKKFFQKPKKFFAQTNRKYTKIWQKENRKLSVQNQMTPTFNKL